MVIVNEHDNHDRQRLDSSLVYIGAHNVYYVKSCLSDAKCFSGSRYSFRVQELNTLLKLDEGSNTASGLGIEILDANMRPVKLNDLHAGMQWIPLVPEQNNILPYSARLKSTQKSVNPGLVRASATFTLEFQ